MCVTHGEGNRISSGCTRASPDLSDLTASSFSLSDVTVFMCVCVRVWVCACVCVCWHLCTCGCTCRHVQVLCVCLNIVYLDVFITWLLISVQLHYKYIYMYICMWVKLVNMLHYHSQCHMTHFRFQTCRPPALGPAASPSAARSQLGRRPEVFVPWCDRAIFSQGHVYKYAGDANPGRLSSKYKGWASFSSQLAKQKKIKKINK